MLYSPVLSRYFYTGRLQAVKLQAVAEATRVKISVSEKGTQMKRDFLKELGLADDIINKIMAENGEDIEREKRIAEKAKADLNEARQNYDQLSQEYEKLKGSAGDAAGIQSKLDELQKKYDADTESLKGQLAARDYMDAVSKAISGYGKGTGLKFSSKAAERDFISELRKKNLELKDGELTGFEDFVKERKEAEPDAFATGKPSARFTGPTSNPNPTPGESPAVTRAREIGRAKAQARQASNNVFDYYAGGNYNPPQTSTN